MKRTIILALITLLCSLQPAFAIPARPGKYTKIQPDGSTLVLQRHGDEFYHWTTDENGVVMAPDASGFYRPASMPTVENLGGRAAADMAAASIRARRAAANQISPRATTVKTYHFPVVLVQFSDVKFTVQNPAQAFSNLLNQEGYSENGGTGSVHDYYWENSMQTFDAQFDVIGPYTYNGTCAGNAEENDAAKILWAAIKNSSNVDWSKYDNDGDNVVDMVFMYYAGYNEAEGNDDTIWPHKYNFRSAGVTTSTLNGKSFNVYACTSELKGVKGYGEPSMCGIGTCAHEFSHTQGLPDFYDVNYNEYGDGLAGATYNYDIMCEGSYNNDGITPPYFTAEERIMMGWLNGYETIPSSGEITIPSIKTNFAYKLATSNTTGSGEYFIFECRGGQGWDAYVTPGLVVYHVDKSTKYSVTYYNMSAGRNYTRNPETIWTSDSQYINASGSHPCFYIVPAADQGNLNYNKENKLSFPGGGGVTYYVPQDWAGNKYDLFDQIAFNANGSYQGTTVPVVTLLRGSDHKGVAGQVTNSAGLPVAGARVNLYTSAEERSLLPDHSIQKISGRILGNLMTYTTTDENGSYSFDLSLETAGVMDIEVVADGYIIKYSSFDTADGMVTRNFQLRGINEPIDYTLKKYDLSSGGIYINGYGETATHIGSVKLSAADLEEYVGRKILSLSFAYTLTDDGETEGEVDSVFGVIDFGTTRKLTRQVSNPESDKWITLDLSEDNLYIPADTDCYFGYALQNCTFGYPWLFSTNNPKDGGFCYALYSGSSTAWKTSTIAWNELSGGNLLIDVLLDDSSDVNYNYIENPGYGSYSVGETFDLNLVEAEGNRKPGTAIRWYFDDEPVTGSSITFKYAGSHLIEARFTTTEGKTKVVELEVSVGL